MPPPVWIRGTSIWLVGDLCSAPETPSCSPWGYAQESLLLEKPRLLPTGFVPRLNCCSKICEWSHEQQHYRQAAKEPGAWFWETAARLARVVSLGLSTEENLLETPPSMEQCYIASELLGYVRPHGISCQRRQGHLQQNMDKYGYNMDCGQIWK